MNRMFTQVPALILMTILFLNLSSCTVAANSPPQRTSKTAMSYKYGSVLFENTDFRLVQKRGTRDNWFNIDDLKGRILEKARGRGMPESVIQESFEEVFKVRYSMECQMEKEGGKYAFFRTGLVFNKGTVLLIENGAFTFRLKSPGGKRVDLNDQGLVMRCGESEDGRYLDSRRGAIRVNWSLQKVDYSKAPNLVYFRLPVQYKGWTVESIMTNQTKMTVASNHP